MASHPKSPEPLPIPKAIRPANSGAFGLFPAANFRLTTGSDGEDTALPQALWFFRHESIAVPLPQQTMAGFSRSQHIEADIRMWNARSPLDTAPDYPPLVWTGAEQVISGAQINTENWQLAVEEQKFDWTLTPRHPLNRSWFDDASRRFYSVRKIHLRGTWSDDEFIARTLWPEDFCLPPNPVKRPLSPTPAALRARIREQARGGAQSPFSVELLWQRPTSASPQEGAPVIGFILNGAQGDDDEAHGGHFATAIGRIGESGTIHDWLVANYYTLDSESEKGIIAASVPLDNYFADLNAGQSWYRPSCMLVAVLRNQRTAAHIQSALGRVFNQFSQLCI